MIAYKGLMFEICIASLSCIHNSLLGLALTYNNEYLKHDTILFNRGIHFITSQIISSPNHHSE